jgi:tetratricopeptide (TPR) repeat protein
MLGLCQFELGKDEPALQNLLAAEQLGVLKDLQLRKVALYHMGVLELRAGKYGDARETFGQLARDRVRTKELTTGLGLAALLMKPRESPMEGTPGASVVERTGEAEVLLAANEFDQAKQKYSQLTSEFPDYPNLHFAFGRLLLETHETDEAVQEFQFELKRDPKNVNSMLEIAVARELVDAQGGLNYAEEAVKLAPGLPFAHGRCSGRDSGARNRPESVSKGGRSVLLAREGLRAGGPESRGRQSSRGICAVERAGSKTTRFRHLWRSSTNA